MKARITQFLLRQLAGWNDWALIVLTDGTIILGQRISLTVEGGGGGGCRTGRGEDE